MENPEDQLYVTFALSDVHNTIQNHIISHEEICEPIDQSIPSNELTEIPRTKVNPTTLNCRISTEILTERFDDDDENSVIYPAHIKREEPHQYTSGDDETMAVEALRQLGGVHPFFESDKTACSRCSIFFTQTEYSKHQMTCTSSMLICTTCGEKFERKIDFNNHMVCHQVDRPHACRTCGNLFRSKANLQSHMSQVHHIEKLHKCLICEADFQRPSSLSNHMKIHNYVAGRAIKKKSVSARDSSQKKLDILRNSDDPKGGQGSSTTTSKILAIQNYDGTRINWPLPSYEFQNDQGTVSISTSNDDKFNDLHEFTVMPNGDVTQCRVDYAQQGTIRQNRGQYSSNLGSFSDPEDCVEVEKLEFGPNNEAQFIEVESESSKSQQHTLCNMNFSRASALVSHEKNHLPKTWSMPVECEFCDNQFQDANRLASHQTTCTKKLMMNSSDPGSAVKWGKHACTECGKKFTTKQKMFRHQWIHRKKTHSCEVCGSQFEKQIQLDEHRLSAHPGDSPFTCGECGKSFVSRQGLWEHGRTHAGSPAHFHCNTCTKTFSSRQGYLIHHRTHTGERPYGCKFCWKAFRDGGTLRKHERIHTGERPHVCPLCSRAFNQKVVLREHVRWVHAAGKNETDVTGPPFRCPLCSALNQDRDELCAHIVKHSDQMIAELKAKTNNDSTKPKISKVKMTKGKMGSQIKINPDTKELEVQHHLLSIADGKKVETLFLVTEEKSLESINSEENSMSKLDYNPQSHQIINSGDSMNLIMIEKRDRPTLMIPAENRNIIHSITSRNRDISSPFIQPAYHRNAIHLVSNENNTLHMITKQNEEFPVLTIHNPEGHGNFAESLEHMIQNDVDTVVRIVDYQECGNGNGSAERNCEICGEDFIDKILLMEHVKTHI